MKRQANALTAVLENWQDVENAIDIYANSAGSALRENEIYLDSWEAKSKAVGAAWNEFVNSFVNSEWIKDFLDGARATLSFLTDAEAAVGALAGVITGVLVAALIKGTFTVEGFNAALLKANILSGGIPLLVGLLTTVAVGVVSWGISASDTAKQIENLTTKIEEQQQAIDELNAKEKEATDLYKEYASLMSKSNAYGLTADEKESLLKISNDLVDTYGLEVQGIDAVTGAYIIGANAINDYVEALRAERLEKQKDQTDARNERIKKNIREAKKGDSELVDETTANKASNSFWSPHTQAVNLNKKYGKDSFEEGFFDIYEDRESDDIEETIRQRIKENSDKTNKEIEEILKSEEVVNYINSVKSHKEAWDTQTNIANSKRQGYINSIIKDLLTNVQVDNADMLDSNSESLLTQMLTPYLTTLDWDKFDQDDFEAKVKEFATHASEGLSEVATKLQTSQTKMMSGELNLSGYEDMYNTLQNKAGLLKQMLDQGIIDQKSYEEQVSQIYSQVANNIGLSMVEIAGKISETDKQSQQNFKNVADSFVALENQFRQGKISSVEYLTSITETIENMDFTKTFGENTEAAQQFFSTLANKSANILQDTITQFESGKMSVKDYGDNLKNFAKQQKELAKNAIEEAKALGMSEDAVKELTDEYDKNSKAIDDAVKKWEELDGINAYLDDNIETLRTTTNVASEAYQSFATGLYNEFTKLSDNMQSQIIADMQKMEGLGHITAENLKAEMAKSTSASAGLASAVASNTNDVFKNLANNGGKVLTALGNAIKNFKYTITFNPNAKFSGGEFNLIKWAKTGGQEGIKLPSISWDITGKAGGGAEGLGEALSGLGQSLSVASDFLDISDYGGGSGGGGKKGSGSDKNKPDYEDPTDAIINRINLRSKELKQEEDEIQNQIEIAELENDHKKQISLTNDLIDTRRKRVEYLNKANAELHNEAEYLRNSNHWDEESWFDSQGNATQAYYDIFNSAKTKEEQEYIKDLFESLSKYKKAYTDNANEIVSLNQEIVKGEKDALNIASDIFDEIDRIVNRHTEELQERADDYDILINQNQALIDGEEKFYEAQKKIRDAQKDISNELAASKKLANWIDKDTRELLFNDGDYSNLSEKLKTIQDDIQTEFTWYQEEIGKLTEDNWYLEEAITKEYERRLESKQREYEIARAELDIAKKQSELNNILAEKNVTMVIGGQLQQVADFTKVKEATEELTELESELADIRRDSEQKSILAKKQADNDNLSSEKAAIENRIRMIEEQTTKMKRAIDDFINPLQSLSEMIELLTKYEIPGLDEDLSKLKDEYIGDKYTSAQANTSYGGDEFYLPSDDNKVVKVNPDGKAPAGLIEGDVVLTGGGAYRINKVFPDGSYDAGRMNTKDYSGYASGTLDAEKGLKKVNELGEETYISKDGTFHNFAGGEIVFTKEQSERLMSMIQSNYQPIPFNYPKIPIYPEYNRVKSDTNNTFSGNIIINSPRDYDDFLWQLSKNIGAKIK